MCEDVGCKCLACDFYPCFQILLSLRGTLYVFSVCTFHGVCVYVYVACVFVHVCVRVCVYMQHYEIFVSL